MLFHYDIMLIIETSLQKMTERTECELHNILQEEGSGDDIQMVFRGSAERFHKAHSLALIANHSLRDYCSFRMFFLQRRQNTHISPAETVKADQRLLCSWE